ncbi:MAG: 30S ribosomal protein S21 [Bacteroidota bacterium]
MLIIEIKDNESIDRALRRYKRKVRDTRILKEVRRRRDFKKPSVVRRNEILKAAYQQKKAREIEN